MFVFGHIGLTFGLIILGLVAFKKTQLLYEMDLRIIALFAMLPDIFDKIIGHVIFRGSLNNGRLISHTLVFLIVILILSVLIYRTYWWLATLPVLTHQLFDTLWYSPDTWLWPAFGWEFEKLDVMVWEHWYEQLFHDPFVYTTELMGLIVVIALVYYFKIYYKKNFVQLVKTGRLIKGRIN